MDDSKAITDLIPDPDAHPNTHIIVSEDGLTVNTGAFARDHADGISSVYLLSFRNQLKLQAYFWFATPPGPWIS